jgi:hypothetical protein
MALDNAAKEGASNCCNLYVLDAQNIQLLPALHAQVCRDEAALQSLGTCESDQKGADLRILDSNLSVSPLSNRCQRPVPACRRFDFMHIQDSFYAVNNQHRTVLDRGPSADTDRFTVAGRRL